MLIHQKAVATQNVLVQVPGDGIVDMLGNSPRDLAADSWVGVAADSCLFGARDGSGVHVNEEIDKRRYCRDRCSSRPSGNQRRRTHLIENHLLLHVVHFLPTTFSEGRQSGCERLTNKAQSLTTFVFCR